MMHSPQSLMQGISPQATGVAPQAGNCVTLPTGGTGGVLAGCEICVTPYPIVRKCKFPEPLVVAFGDKILTIVGLWSTGTALFYQVQDGRIAALRKDGTVRIYRPQKHLVISRNPRIKTFDRARKRFDKLSKMLPAKASKAPPKGKSGSKATCSCH